MDGVRRTVTSADGARIGMLTGGSGPVLLLVHGGMGQLERWSPIWGLLTREWTVTAIDRRGRGFSTDGTAPYGITAEYDDITTVAQLLAAEHGGPVDVFAHSYGATCTLGAAAGGAPFRRIVLYEPPGPETVPLPWVQRITAYIADGRPGRAMASFLTEIIGLTDAQVEQLRNSPGTGDVLDIVTATMPREAHALTSVDLPSLAERITCPTLLITGSSSPPWAQAITGQLAANLPQADVVTLPGHGHEAIDTASRLIESTLRRFLQAPIETTNMRSP